MSFISATQINNRFFSFIMIKEYSYNSVFAIPVGEDYLVYAPLKQVSALVNRKACHEFQKQFTGYSKYKILASMAELQKELKLPNSAIIHERSGPIRPAFLGIILSRACNMSCIYCNFGSKVSSDGKLNTKMAVAAVDWMAEYVSRVGKRSLEIHFFGGEPFVEPEITDVVIHRGRYMAEKLGLIPHFEVSTNGLFDETRAVFVGDYFDAVVLSLDGFREIHDRHRPINSSQGSFDIVSQTAKRLSLSPTELCLRCCISHLNVNQMEDITRWFCENFKPAVINFETLAVNHECEVADLRAPDPYVFAGHCIRAYRVAESFGIRPVYAAISTDGPRNSFCPVGKDTLIISPDGRVSSCYLPDHEWKARGLDMDVGHLSKDGNMTVDMDAIQQLRRLVTEKPRCKACFCQWSCAGGCHVSHSYPGCSNKYNDFCIQTRIIMTCFLLDKMGLSNITNELINSHAAMEALAFNPSDRLEDLKV